MFINIIFWLGNDRLSGFLSFAPLYFFTILTPLFLPSSSFSLSYIILGLGKYSCMSSPFPIAILNGTSCFLSLVQEKLNMPSGHSNWVCSRSGRSNHIIKNYLSVPQNLQHEAPTRGAVKDLVRGPGSLGYNKRIVVSLFDRHVTTKEYWCPKRASSIQYGYRKWGTHARVFSQTPAHGNSKIEIRQWNRGRRWE